MALPPSRVSVLAFMQPSRKVVQWSRLPIHPNIKHLLWSMCEPPAMVSFWANAWFTICLQNITTGASQRDKGGWHGSSNKGDDPSSTYKALTSTEGHLKLLRSALSPKEQPCPALPVLPTFMQWTPWKAWSVLKLEHLYLPTSGFSPPSPKSGFQRSFTSI